MLLMSCWRVMHETFTWGKMYAVVSITTESIQHSSFTYNHSGCTFAQGEVKFILPPWGSRSPAHPPECRQFPEGCAGPLQGQRGVISG